MYILIFIHYFLCNISHFEIYCKIVKFICDVIVLFDKHLLAFSGIVFICGCSLLSCYGDTTVLTYHGNHGHTVSFLNY